MIYLCSYKGTGKGASAIVSKGIRFVTTSDYSHTEISIGNPFEGEAYCVTSSGMDGGVRGKVMKLSPDSWDITPLPHVTQQQVLDWLAKHKGAKYDWGGTTRFLFPFMAREHDTRWFCSESCADMIGINEPWRLDPASLTALAKSNLFASFEK